MRRIYDPNSFYDTTATVQGYLAAGQSFVFADLYTFYTTDFIDANPNGGNGYWTYTDAAFPIFVKQIQAGWLPGSYVPKVAQLGPLQISGVNLAIGLTYQPELISHSDFAYEVGFNSNPVTIPWVIDETKAYGPWLWNGTSAYISAVSNCIYPANLTLKQALLMGLFDRVPVWIHRAIFYPDFPNRGGSLVGTTLMHRGYVRDVVGTSESVQIKIDSLMQVFRDTQVPVQTIMPNSRSVLFVPTATAPFGADFSNPVPISPLVVSVSTAEAVTASALADCWVSFCPAGGALQNFKSGNPLPPLYRIRDNTPSIGTGFIELFLYKPYVLGISATVNVYGQTPF